MMTQAFSPADVRPAQVQVFRSSDPDRLIVACLQKHHHLPAWDFPGRIATGNVRGFRQRITEPYLRRESGEDAPVFWGGP
jgi:hypothetical protein